MGWLAGLLLLACAPQVGLAAKRQPAASPAQPLRLDLLVQPRAYDLALTIDPALPRYQGVVQIDLALAKPTATIRLHAQGLQIGSAFVETGAHRWAARVKPVDAARIDLVTAKPAPAGPARLVITFAGPLSATGTLGLVRRQTEGRWWALARFDPDGARLALPLLDEPGWRVPWRLTLTVPEALQALANTPLAQQETAEPGHKRLRFEPTPPLPSHQLALAVGAFGMAPAGQAGPVTLRWAAPARTIVPPSTRVDGDTGNTVADTPGDATAEALAADLLAQLLRLETEVGQAYPFAQLDLLVLPPGSGLGPFSQPGLLAWPAEAQPGPLGEALARSWFGQWVGPTGWPDRWLLDALAASLGHGLAPAATAQATAQATDVPVQPALPPLPVRPGLPGPPPGSPAAPDQAQAKQLLADAAQALGPTAWRAVLRRFLERHAWGQATVADFLAVLAAADAAAADTLGKAIGLVATPATPAPPGAPR